jgi:hypothetical protein
MNHCPHCGERVEPRDAYCFECGERLPAGAEQTETDQGTAGDEQPPEDSAPAETRPPGAVSSETRRSPESQSPDEGRARGGRAGRESQRPEGRSGGERPRRRGSGGARETGGRPPAAGEYGQARGGYRRERPPRETGGRVESLTTLWVATGLAVLALVESLSVIVFADEFVELVADSGFGGDVSAGTIAVSGGIGAVIALGLAGLCLYYYRQGYVERRFFWGLIVGGGAGFLLGAGISFLVLIAVGAYGLLVVVKRDRPRERAGRV